MHKVYTLRTNVTFTAPDLTFQTHVSSFMRGKDVSPEMPINRGMEGKGDVGTESIDLVHSIPAVPL